MVAPVIRLGVSSCLLGEPVRFDGGHKRDGFLVDTVARLVELVPVCPEVEMGLGVPREAVRLLASTRLPGMAGKPVPPGEDGRSESVDRAPVREIRLVGSRSGIDHTERMARWTDRRLDELSAIPFDGYLLKKGSPSCGLKVKVYDESGMPSSSGRGRFAEALTERWPLLPVEDDGRLQDAGLREHFFVRVFAHHRWRTFLDGRPAMRDLVAFHSSHKYLLLAHSPARGKALGPLVAVGGTRQLAEVLCEYEHGFFAALAVRATRGKHVNVLQHLAGFVSDSINARTRAELAGLIDDYQAGIVSLAVPLTLLRHLLLDDGVHEWARRQEYLAPHPKELALRTGL